MVLPRIKTIQPFICLFYFWMQWVFVVECGLSLVAASGGYSLLGCVGFSCGAWALLVWFSVSCGAQTYLLHVMWGLSGPDFKTVSPPLAGGFHSTVLPGKS